MSKKNEQEKINLQDQFEQIQNTNPFNTPTDMTKYLASEEDLADFGEIQIYDYDSDLTKATEQSYEVLKSLVDLYLGDVPSVSDHKYIKTKMREDAQVYAETIFLNKMTRKNFLTQLKQIDGGDTSARLHEIVNQTISQIRENSKYSAQLRTQLESFYKEIRKDLGLNDLAQGNAAKPEEPQAEEGKEEGRIVDPKQLNDMIDTYLKNKK